MNDKPLLPTNAIRPATMRPKPSGLLLVGCMAAVGCMGKTPVLDTTNELVDCPVDRTYDEATVYGSILFCEDINGETCHGDHCDCWTSPPNPDDVTVLVELNARSELGKAVMCVDEERLAEFEASGVEGAGYPYLFAYASSSLTAVEKVVIYSTSRQWGDHPSDAPECWGEWRRKLNQDSVAVLELTGFNIGGCN